MTGSTIALIVCVAAIWMAQRLLTIWQSLRFRRQLIALREHGKLSVGMAKKIGRRVFVGLTVDQHGIVTANLVLRGVTVFALGKPNPALIGCRATDLAAGRTPPGGAADGGDRGRAGRLVPDQEDRHHPGQVLSPHPPAGSHRRLTSVHHRRFTPSPQGHRLHHARQSVDPCCPHHSRADPAARMSPLPTGSLPAEPDRLQARRHSRRATPSP